MLLIVLFLEGHEGVTGQAIVGQGEDGDQREDESHVLKINEWLGRDLPF